MNHVDRKDVDAKEISVIIPVFNAARFLPAAIDNVLEQGMDSLEILVIDDGSIDETATVADGLASRIRYAAQAHRGPSAARNHGLRLASGKYVAFLDCDDRWPPDNLKIQKALLDREPDVDIVMGKIEEQHYDTGKRRYESSGFTTFSPSLVAMLTRKSTFDKVGLLDESIWIGEDKDWFIRAKECRMNIRYLDDHLAQYHRRHDSNITNSMDAPESYWLSLLRKSLLRRKQLKGGNS